MNQIITLFKQTLRLFYPHHCIGCNTDQISPPALLCFACLHHLPHTGFHLNPNNIVEQLFVGRVELQAAHSEFYFSKGELVQHMMHQLKYAGKIEIGIYLGEMMGKHLLEAKRFQQIDFIVPLPMHPKKERKRGYNQATVISQGVSNSTKIPLLIQRVIRKKITETQTKKDRTQRWQNVVDSFEIVRPETLKGKHLLLIDDVLTTGATMDACCAVLQTVPNIKLSIATIAIASK